MVTFRKIKSQTKRVNTTISSKPPEQRLHWPCKLYIQVSRCFHLQNGKTPANISLINLPQIQFLVLYSVEHSVCLSRQIRGHPYTMMTIFWRETTDPTWSNSYITEVWFQDYAKTARLNLMKPGGEMEHRQRENLFNFIAEFNHFVQNLWQAWQRTIISECMSTDIIFCSLTLLKHY